LAIFFLIVQLVHGTVDKQSAEILFSEWSIQWNKTYTTQTERDARFNIFIDNLIKISINKAKHSKATFGLNKFSDMTSEEFKRFYLNTVISKPSVPVRSHVHPSAIPTVPIDWKAKGKVTPVKTEGECGSAFAIGVAETVESANMVLGKPMTLGSVKEILDCASSGGCSGGDPLTAFKWVISQGGLETETCYGDSDGTCKVSQCPINPDPNLRLTGIVQVPPNNDLALYNALVTAPVFVLVDATAWQSYTGGVLSAAGCGSSIDHCVQVTGYSPNQGGYWTLKNSWSEAWGMNGYINLEYGRNACGITTGPILGKV